MDSLATRRGLLFGAAGGWLALAGPRLAGAGYESAAESSAAVVPPGWPTQEPALAREMVGVSHGNVARVRELLARNPSLARAAWDWGFGDWESALGAASHVGNPEIAELLLAHGARPSIFSAAMLGQLDAVRGFVAASPGIQRVKGPHGFTLLHHARVGGEAAKAVVAYLTELGDADREPELAPLADAERDALVGSYRFGGGATETISIVVNRFGLAFERAGTSARKLSHLGDLTFFPVGVEGARIRFERATGATGARIASLVVHDPDFVLRAVRESERSIDKPAASR